MQLRGDRAMNNDIQKNEKSLIVTNECDSDEGVRIFSRFLNEVGNLTKLDVRNRADRENIRILWEVYLSSPDLHHSSHFKICMLRALVKELAVWEQREYAVTVSEFPLNAVVEALKERMNDITSQSFLVSNYSDLVGLIEAIDKACMAKGLVSPLKGQALEGYVSEICAVEAVIDLYTNKICTVRQNTNLTEADKVQKIQQLHRLLSTHIVGFEQSIS